MTANAARKRYHAHPDDALAFAREHPETVVSSALLEQLNNSITSAAYRLAIPGEDLEDVRQSIVEGIIVNARSYVLVDGEPVYDLLAQHPSYIVQRGFAYAFVRFRRERRLVAHQVNLSHEGDEFEADPIMELSDEGLEVASTVSNRVDHASFVEALRADLTTQQRIVLDLLASGVERSELASMLHVRRQTVHKHLSRIAEKAESLRPMLNDLAAAPSLAFTARIS
jgi:DNA-binding NarL/FixJ family response regulator